MPRETRLALDNVVPNLEQLTLHSAMRSFAYRLALSDAMSAIALITSRPYSMPSQPWTYRKAS